MQGKRLKISPNAPCPCHSVSKYKKCCSPFHQGKTPLLAQDLMRSRYSAYALGLSRYIIATTHPHNHVFVADTQKWAMELDDYSQNETFVNLVIIDTTQDEHKAFVTFCATLGSGTFTEKSLFEKINGIWLYKSGEFL
jgi:SEC-C motif-containing protein